VKTHSLFSSLTLSSVQRLRVKTPICGFRWNSYTQLQYGNQCQSNQTTTTSCLQGCYYSNCETLSLRLKLALEFSTKFTSSSRNVLLLSNSPSSTTFFRRRWPSLLAMISSISSTSTIIQALREGRMNFPLFQFNQLQLQSIFNLSNFNFFFRYLEVKCQFTQLKFYKQ